MPISVEPLAKSIAAEVSGADLGAALSEGDFNAVHDAFLEHSVLVFRGRSQTPALTPDRHIALTRRFGEAEVHMLDQFHHADHPEILILSNGKDSGGKPLGLEDAGRYWHTDVSYAHRPGMASFLYAHDVPPKGGDTVFASTRAAYDALSADWKARLQGLRAVHGLNRITAPKFTDEQFAALDYVEHPLVRTHPETRRKAIYTGAFALSVAGLPENESRGILEFLADHCAKPEFQYRHAWRAHDLVMWDNRCVVHHATGFDRKHLRHMHRTTVAGGVPV